MSKRLKKNSETLNNVIIGLSANYFTDNRKICKIDLKKSRKRRLDSILPLGIESVSEVPLEREKISPESCRQWSMYQCHIHNDDRTICEIYECDGKYPNLDPHKIPEYIS